ncbi:cytochrome B5 [Chloroflexota bacterium]
MKEMGKCDGNKGIDYVAYQSRVYDVSNNYHWRTGFQHAIYQAGTDLTVNLKQASHTVVLLQKFSITGELVES